MDAVALVLVGTLLMFVFGVPLALRAYPDHEADRIPVAFVLAPVLGYGVLTTALRATSALGAGVQSVAWPIAAAGVAVLALSVRRYGLARLGARLRATWGVWAVLACVLGLVSVSYALVGATFYRGYSWQDTVFYAAQAESLRVAAPQNVESSFGQQPFTELVTSFADGPERLARALMQAFVAAVTNMDGASTTGFAGIIAVGMIFLSLLFVTHDLPMNHTMRLAACASAALLPAVVVGQLEGFLPLALLTGQALVMIRLLVDVALSPSVWRTLASAFVLAGGLFTLMEALFVFGALTLVVLVAALVLEHGRLRGSIHLLMVWVVGMVLCIPLGDRLLGEFVNARAAMTRTELNSIYPFAFTPRSLTWSFWGTAMEGRTDLLATAATGVAVLLFVVGGYAILRLMLEGLSTLGVALSAYVLLPCYFLLSGEDLAYSFYKMLSLTLPLVWFGAWLAAGALSSRLAERLQGFRAPRVAQVLHWSPVALVVVAGLLSSLVSAERVLAVSTDRPEQATPSTRIGLWRAIDRAPVLASLAAYDRWSDSDVVMAYPTGTQEFWFAAYYLRRNTLWTLSPTADDLYAGADGPERDLASVPLDAKIAYAESYDDLGVGAQARGDFAIVAEASLGDAVSPFERVGQEFYLDGVGLRIFTRRAGRLDVEIVSKSPDVLTARLPGRTVELVPGSNVIRIPVAAGGQRVPLEIETTDEGALVAMGRVRFRETPA